MANDTIKKPDSEWFEWLTDLRDSGAINMMGAPRIMHEEMGVPLQEARDIFTRWAKHLTEQRNATD